MDTVTHALVGTAVSDAFFRKRLGPVATPFALVLSSLPDIDVFVYFVSPEHAWVSHRGYTHSFLPMLIASPILGYFGYRVARRAGTWVLWTALAALCLFLHTAFDLVTSWGTMPLLPFSNARISWDIVPIIDVFLFSITAASFVANRVLRWERVDYFPNPLAYPVVHKHPRRQVAATRFATVAVLLVVGYLLIGWQQNRQAIRRAEAMLAESGFTPVETRAIPYLFTYLSGNLVSRDADGNIKTAVYSSLAPDSLRFRDYPASGENAVTAALDSPWGRLFTWYSQRMVEAKVVARTGEAVAGQTVAGPGAVVHLFDRRFGVLTDPDSSRFVMEIEVDASGRATAGKTVTERLTWNGIRKEFQRLAAVTLHGDS